MESIEERLVRKGELLLPAIAYGDSAGLPFETKSHGYIVGHYGEVDHLMDIEDNPLFKEAKVGMWSDDTQLSLAVARGVLKGDGFNIFAIADEHMKEYNNTPLVEMNGKMKKRGWGGSTSESVERLINGASPFESGAKDGTGNGVLIKMAPLVLWQIGNHVPADERAAQYDVLTTMTHDNDLARLCSRIYGDILVYISHHGYNTETFPDAVNTTINQHEHELGLDGTFESLRNLLYYPPTKITDVLDASLGNGFNAWDTITRAVGAMILGNGKFKQSVYTAVNMGGDTDSTASITAAMSVFGDHTVEFPEDYDKLHRRFMIERLSSRLARKAFGLVETTR